MLTMRDTQLRRCGSMFVYEAACCSRAVYKKSLCLAENRYSFYYFVRHLLENNACFIKFDVDKL